MLRFLTLFLVLLTQSYTVAGKQKLLETQLSKYGPLDEKSVAQTLEKAIADIDGKRLILPSIKIDTEYIIIEGKSHFAIVGNREGPVYCRQFQFLNCHDFDLSCLYLKGTKAKFTTFDIVGNCYNFYVHNCRFDSEKGADGHNTFYGIHIITDTHSGKNNFENSPRNFRIYANEVNNTRYDGILAHAYCSDFVIEKNRIVGAECIGIEVEGRLGGLKNTTVHPCKNVTIRNNEMIDCGDWGVLLMWTDGVKVYKNNCVNSFGAFLSIGCTNLVVKNNVFEGRNKGFEISQEFYKVSNGINNHVVVTGNTIKAKARSANRGVLDIRHARDVVVKKNRITSLYRDETAYVSLASCQQVTILKNRFAFVDEPLKDFIYKANVPSPETDKNVPELDLKDLSIQEITIRKE